MIKSTLEYKKNVVPFSLALGMVKCCQKSKRPTLFAYLLCYEIGNRYLFSDADIGLLSFGYTLENFISFLVLSNALQHSICQYLLSFYPSMFTEVHISRGA